MWESPSKLKTTKSMAMQAVKASFGIGDKVFVDKASGHAFIKLDLICPRAIHKFTITKDGIESLMASIEKFGLLANVLITEIEPYLKNNLDKLSDEEIAYYKYQLNEGRKYFITSGHRRFYAHCSLCTGKIYHTKDEIISFYSVYKELSSFAFSDLENRNMFLAIKSKILDVDFESERKIHLDANFCYKDCK